MGGRQEEKCSAEGERKKMKKGEKSARPVSPGKKRKKDR